MKQPCPCRGCTIAFAAGKEAGRQEGYREGFNDHAAMQALLDEQYGVRRPGRVTYDPRATENRP